MFDKICTNLTFITGGIDYGSGPYSVMFSAEQTYAVFDVPITDDNHYEGNENFVLTINPSSLLSHVTPGNPRQATVTIVDNDGKEFLSYNN